MPPTAPRWVRALPPLLIAAATFAAFSPALHNDLLGWDDELNLVDNDAYRGLGARQLAWMFTTFHGGHYQPLSWMSLSLDHALWGVSARGFHLTNLILHAANAVLFYLLARRLFELAMPQVRRDSPTAVLTGAALAALVFALHPLRVESVAWATERRDVLSGFFWLLTLHAYLRAHAAPPRSRGWLALSVLCLALALLSKVMAATLPAVLVVLDVYPLRRLGPRRWLTRDAGAVWLEKLPFFVLAVAVAAIAPLAQVNVESMRTLEQYGLGPRLTQTLYGFAFYLHKTLLPVGLAPLYELPPTVRLSQAPYLISALAAAAITVALVIARHRWPAGLAVWACYCAILLPVSGILQNGPQIAADRYSYLSCMGWAVLAGAGLIVCRRDAPPRGHGTSFFRPAVVTAAVGLAALALLTRRQTALWRDSMSLWSQAVAVEPQSSIGNNLLGKALAARGQIDEAIARYNISLQTNPAHAEALNNLANALARKGQIDRAIDLYRRVLRLDPDFARAHYNLGTALLMAGQPQDALASFRRAVTLDPSDAPSWNNLAGTLLLLGRHEEGISTLREGLARVPRDAELARNLAWTLATCPQTELRDGSEAVRLAERACALTGYRDARALRTLAAAYDEAGRPADAARAARLAEQAAAHDRPN